MERTVFLLAFPGIYYHISGLATTNMLRLTRGNICSVWESRCTCDACGAAIPPLLQLPIISYVLCKGRCRQCGAAIPRFSLVLEVTVWCLMTLLTALCGFSVMGVSLSFLGYELVRVAVLALYGRRETDFAGQYIRAVVSMLPFYGMTVFVALLYSVVIAP